MFSPTTITIVHFNDVYNIEPGTQEPVGGAARFTTAVRQMADVEPLVLFSGDAFNPALMSAITNGRQMVPILNEIGVHCAIYGNHDFDHGVDNLVKLAKETNFPWLLSNVYDIMTGSPLAEGIVSHIITWRGKKIGFIGLIEEEWMATLSTFDPEDLDYLDFVTEGRRLATDLKKQGVDYVIALTHMRWPNDIKLAESVPEIDLILGGHDHDFGVRDVNGRKVIKSGTDFRQFALVTLTFHEDGHVDVEAKESVVDSSITEDEKVKGIVDEYSKLMGEKMDNILGQIDVDLDGRFECIRRQETNLGNFVADIMLKSTDADVALLNSGTLRSDRIHPRGDFRLRDLMSILPMIDSLVVISVTGAQLLAALENGVSKFPALEGRFPQVAGVTFDFDSRKPPMERIIYDSVVVQGEKLNPEKMYRLCTKGYLAKGKDGYDSFANTPVLVNEDDGPQLSTIVQNHFQSVNYLTGACTLAYHHHQSLITRKLRRSLSHQVSVSIEDKSNVGGEDQVDAAFQKAARSNPRMRWQKARYALAFTRMHNIQEAEKIEIKVALAPKVQHRMRNLSDDQ